MKPRGSRSRGIPLIKVITAVVVVIVLIVTGTLGFLTYVRSKKTIADLWHETATNLAARTGNEAVRFLEPAYAFVALSRSRMTTGALSAQRPEELLVYLTEALAANPTFSWASWGDADGTFLSAYRWPTDDGVRIRRTWRDRVSGPTETAATPDGAYTYHREWEQRPGGAWELIDRRTVPEGEPRSYDPRVRPWYRVGIEAPPGEGGWVDPYLFLSRMQTGVAFAQASFDEGNGLVGVWCAEFEAGPLSDYLGGLRVAESGRVYLVDQSGTVVGHPTGQVVGERASGPPELLDAASHPDPMLAQSWAEMSQRSGDERWAPFQVGDYHAVALPLPADSGIPWLVLTVVPADELFSSVRAQARKALAVALSAVLLALLLGLVVSRRLSGSVETLTAELGRVARFELDDPPVGDTPSLIREVNEMSKASDAMKQGLRSFSRYVPHQLVRQLIRSGREAKLGGELREMTVLFSDIVGFTTLVESRSPDEVVQALGHYLEALNVEIGTTRGTVCQYLGDAIMAFWGAPEPRDDHALAACRGVLAMDRRSLALEGESNQTGAPALPTRFGLNTGVVMVGNIGAPQRFNYGIVGDVVNTASRIEGLNRLYGTRVLIGEETAAEVAEELVVRPVDWVRMKGKTKPMLVYELLGEIDALPRQTFEAMKRYGEALQAYRAGRFESALAAFEGIDLDLAGDAPSRLMADRCRRYLDDPPPDAWDGVFVLRTK